MEVCYKLDQMTLINVDKPMVDEWKAKEYIEIESDSPYEIAGSLALQDWEYSDDAVIAVIGEDFKEPDTKINNMIKGRLPVGDVKEISVKSKEENIYITKSDTTPELLAFELYGSATDENINNIINDNDLFGNSTLSNSWRNMIIRKNIEIVYYV